MLKNPSNFWLLLWNNSLAYKDVSTRLSASILYITPTFAFGNFPVALPKKLYHFTLAFDSSHETVQKMPVPVHLLVCETFVVTLCQHLSVFMSTQIVYYPTQVPGFYLFIHYVTEPFRCAHHSLTSSVTNVHYERDQIFPKVFKNVILIFKVLYW